MTAPPPSPEAAPIPAPADAAARFASLLAAVVAGFAATAAGLCAGTPAPTTLWRAVAAAAGTRVLVGWIAAALVAGLARPEPAATRAAEEKA